MPPVEASDRQVSGRPPHPGYIPGCGGFVLSGVALSGVALTGVALSGVALTGAALTGAALNGVAPTSVALTGVDCRRSERAGRVAGSRGFLRRPPDDPGVPSEVFWVSRCAPGVPWRAPGGP